MWILTTLTEIFFPKRCFVCKKEGVSLCDRCLTRCKLNPDSPSPLIFSTYYFKDEHIKKIIHAIKYYNRPDLVEPLVRHSITEELRSFCAATENTILIPIPMPRLRLWKRGYNQSEKIARAYSKLLSIPVITNTLLRASSSPQQAKQKHRSDREKNAHGIFKVVTITPIAGKDIILIDDTVTTGATLLEARKALLAKGVKSVKAIALAH